MMIFKNIYLSTVILLDKLILSAQPFGCQTKHDLICDLISFSATNCPETWSSESKPLKQWIFAYSLRYIILGAQG